MVGEEFRGLGIAQHLVRVISDAARENGMAGLIAPVNRSNRAMLHIFLKVLGRADQTIEIGDDLVLRYDFEDASFEEDFISS